MASVCPQRRDQSWRAVAIRSIVDLMTATKRPDITLEHPGDVIASLPPLLGFHPVDSLVVLGMCGARATELAIVLRTDLPPASRARELAHTLLAPLVQQEVVGITMVVVGGGTPTDDDLPHSELMIRCENVFVDNGIPVIHQLWTPDTASGRSWRCYDETDCGGVVADPAATELAAVIEEAGLTVFPRREDIVATLTPESPDVLSRRSQSLQTSSTETEPTGTDPPSPGLSAVHAAIEAAVHVSPTLTDHDVTSLAGALADHRIRDICLDVDELPDAAAAERLWTALAKATPPPESAEAACLLAFSAYARGDGVLAGIALDRAEAADPGHRLTGLLRSALSLGLPPEKIRTVGVKAATSAREALKPEEPPHAHPDPATD